MKKTLFFLILLISGTIQAQEKPSFFSLLAGTSLPVGGFHSKELPDGGFALPGMNVSMEGAWFFKPWIGVGAQAGIYFHPVDIRTLGYEKVIADPFMDDVYIRSNPYMTIAANAGLFFNFPLIQRLSLTAKTLGGMMYSETPYQLYKAEYYLVGEQWYEITASGDYEFSFLAGAGLRYNLKSCIGFVLNTDFTYNVLDFDFITLGGDIRTDKKIISYIDISAGLVIGF